MFQALDFESAFHCRDLGAMIVVVLMMQVIAEDGALLGLQHDHESGAVCRRTSKSVNQTCRTVDFGSC